MAEFRDQFKKCNPFAIPNRSEFYGWPSQIAREAQELLLGQSVDRLTAIAVQIEKLISRSTERAEFRKEGRRHEVATFFKEKMFNGNFPRHLYGDLNLFSEAHDDHAWDMETIKSTKWERYTVFCLWKLVDEYLAITEKFDPVLGITWDVHEIRTINSAGGCIIEATRALQVAQSILLEERLVSARNRDNGIMANPNAEANRLLALEMAEELPFRSMNKAAEHIALVLVKGTTKRGIDTYYTTEWIKGWLRDAGWTPQHKRKTPQ